MESQIHVLVPSNRRPWGGCEPLSTSSSFCFWVCLAVALCRMARSHSCRTCDVTAVAAGRQWRRWGSKCDCSMVLLLDLAVKWDWRPSYLSDWLTNSYWEYLSFKRAIHAGTDLKGTECLGVRYVNKSGYYFMFVNMCWNCYVQFLFLQRTSMHMDCIYIVPSISSFHIVYFCGMYVPVKMQICVFIFNLQYM